MWQNWAIFSVEKNGYLTYEDDINLCGCKDVIASRGYFGPISQNKVILLSSKNDASHVINTYRMFKDPLDFCTPVQILPDMPLFIDRGKWLASQRPDFDIFME